MPITVTAIKVSPENKALLSINLTDTVFIGVVKFSKDIDYSRTANIFQTTCSRCQALPGIINKALHDSASKYITGNRVYHFYRVVLIFESVFDKPCTAEGCIFCKKRNSPKQLIRALEDAIVTPEKARVCVPFTFEELHAKHGHAFMSMIK